MLDENILHRRKGLTIDLDLPQGASFSEKELGETVHKLRSGKAPGIDKIRLGQKT